MRLAKFLFISMVLSGPSLWACEVCFGNPDDPQTKGMQGAILTMLFITYFTLLTIIGVFIYLFKRSRRLATDNRSLPC